MVGFFLLGIYGRMVAYLPAWCVSLLCAVITKVALATSLRSRVERGMRRFPWSSDDNIDAEDLARRHIRFLVDVFHHMLYCRYHHRPRHGVANAVRCEGEEHLKEALKAKEGVILVSLHLGNFFWSITYLASTYPANLVVRGEHNPRWEAFGSTMREKAGIKTIYSEGGGVENKGAAQGGGAHDLCHRSIYTPLLLRLGSPPQRHHSSRSADDECPGHPLLYPARKRGYSRAISPPLKEVSPSALEALVMQGIRESPPLWFWWRRLGKVKRGERTS